nr:MAG TPA: hypothetical protein [Caudoviricetes sp.]
MGLSTLRQNGQFFVVPHITIRILMYDQILTNFYYCRLDNEKWEPQIYLKF